MDQDRLGKYQQAIALAEQEGNQQAAVELKQEAARELTGPGSFTERLGAGMQDLIVGGKQLVGQADPEAVREHLRTAESATGGTLGGKLTRGLGTATLAAPAMLIPGAGSVAGSAAIGAGTGLLEPVNPDQNVVSGKAKAALFGGAAGGLTQGALNVAGRVLPRALSAVQQGLRRFTGGGRGRLAEEAFVGSIPAAERAGVEQAARGAVQATRPPMAQGVSGAPFTTAGASASAGTPSATLLGAERHLREAGGELAQPLREVSEQAAQARWGHLQQNLGGNVPGLAQRAADVYDQFISGAQLRRPFDAKGALGDDMVAAINQTKNPTVRGELERIFQQYVDSRAAGDVQSLHELRMTAFDDALARLSQSDRNAAKILRNTITRFKSTFDDEMDRALGPGRQWSRFLDDYSTAAGAREQARAGEELLGQLATKNETLGGVPQLTGSRQTLARAATATDDFGQPVYSPGGVDALRTVRQEIGAEAAPYAVGPRGSATAQNLNPTGRVLSQALAAQQRLAQPVVPKVLEAVGTTMGAPGAATGMSVLQRGLDRQTVDIARRMVELYADPQAAAEALARANLPPQVRQNVLALLTTPGFAEAVGQTARGALPATLAATAAQPQ